jgi:hypothetical protein
MCKGRGGIPKAILGVPMIEGGGIATKTVDWFEVA